MTSLKFPTMAEQALARWRAATKTTALARVALEMGADVEHVRPYTKVYTFDDDTSLEVTGRGSTHKVTAHLP